MDQLSRSHTHIDCSRFDTKPSILDLPLSTRSNTSPTDEPDAKRPALDANTIETRIKAGRYRNTSDLLEDVEQAVAGVIKKHEAAVSQQPNGTQVATYEIRLHTAVFKKYLQSLLSINKDEITGLYKLQNDEGSPMVNGKHGDGAVAAPKLESSPVLPAKSGKTALTFFGASTNSVPTQMFSYLHNQEDPHVKAEVDLSEVRLPNGIFLTSMPSSVVPKQLLNKPKPKTFGEVFQPPPKLPRLDPPAAPSFTKPDEKSIGWVQPTHKVALKGTKMDFRDEMLPSGFYLNNGFSREPYNFDSWKNSFQPKNKQESGYVENLVRSAYSSFTPSRDNSIAIVPRDLKSRIWWTKYNDRIASAYPLDGLVDELSLEETKEQPEELDLTGIEEAISKYVPEEPPKQTDSKHLSDLDTETESLLMEVSDLLLTLSSYAKLRNLSAPSSTGATTVPQPSTEEKETYEMLKTALTTMIATLPPYLVSKLDGEQLAELTVSTALPGSAPQFHGGLEEDDHALALRRMKAVAAQQAAARIPAAADRTPQRTGSYGGGGAAAYTPRPGYPTVSRPSHLPHGAAATQTAYAQRPPQQTPQATPSAMPRPQYAPNQQTPSHAPTFPPRPGVNGYNNVPNRPMPPSQHAQLRGGITATGSPQKPQPGNTVQATPRFFQTLPQQGRSTPQPPMVNQNGVPAMNVPPPAPTPPPNPNAVYQRYDQAATDLRTAMTRPQMQPSRSASGTPQPPYQNAPQQPQSQVNGVSGSATPDRMASATPVPAPMQNGAPPTPRPASTTPGPATPLPKVEGA